MTSIDENNDEISCRVSVYVPESSSMLQRFAAWLTGRRPELIDPTILATGGGRERKAIFRATFSFHVPDLILMAMPTDVKLIELAKIRSIKDRIRYTSAVSTYTFPYSRTGRN